jgi:hypothetical protein
MDGNRLAFRRRSLGRGKAFRCKAADCGGEVQLYVRAKLSFSNCATGVADDGDLEQMGDLIGKATPVAAWPISDENGAEITGQIRHRSGPVHPTGK